MENSIEKNIFDDFGGEVPNKVINNERESDAPVTAVEATHASNALGNFNQWAIRNNNSFLAVGSTIKKLESGLYSLLYTDAGILFTKQNIETDNLLKFPESIMQQVIDEITFFWKNGEEFKNYGFLHRRGYLFYGNAGSGKTCLVSWILKEFIENGGIVLNCNMQPNLIISGIRVLRAIEPDRQIICLFEDIDAIINKYGEDSILSLLDGEESTNYVLNVASTNYPERLDKRIVARPRRFDRVIKIDNPNESTRRIFFKEKLKINGEELNKYVTETAGFSFAAMSELVISTKCFNIPFLEALELLKKMMLAKHSSDEYYTSKTGFKN